MSVATSIDPKQVHEIIGRHQLADGYDMVLDLDKSHGPWLHDAGRGEDFLDCFTCFASWPLGYNHPGLEDPGAPCGTPCGGLEPTPKDALKQAP